MSKTIKILAVLLMVIMLASVANVAFAEELTPGSVNPKYEGDTGDLKDLAGNITGWIRNIAAVISVVILSILGIKFMIGSTEERAEYKKSFLPLIIGIFVVLSASTLAGWIWSVLNK